MTSQDPFAADAAAALAGAGPEAIRRALRGPPGRVALRLPWPAAPAAQRIALALLAEAAASRGGTILRLVAGDLLLTEADAAEAERAAARIEAVLGQRPAALPLPEAAEDLLALAGTAAPVAPAPPPPGAAGIEALADAAPLPALLRREGVLHIAPGEAYRLAMLRLRLAPDALSPHLGAAGADPDLLRHACDRLRLRLLALLGDPGQRHDLLGGVPAVPLLLDLPAAALPDLPEPPADAAPPAPSLFAAVSLAEALAHPLAPRRAAWRHAGWHLAIRGLDAARLALLAPEALPADLLLLRWSRDLPGRASTAALRRVDPARLVLVGCDGPEALEWGLSLGIARFAGPSVAALMAAARMAACRHAGACSRAQCAARGAAAAAAGRAGCADLELLAALVPPA